MKHRKQPLAALFAVLFMAIASQPAFAYLYTSWGAPTISDPGFDAGAGAKDITGVWYAKDTSFHYFRMDVTEPIWNLDHANLYSIILSTSPNALTAYTSDGITFAASPASPNFEFSDGKRLEWKIPRTDLADVFQFSGSTISFFAGPPFVQFHDTTATVATPIPSAALLLGTGLIGLVGLRRRSFRQA